MHAGSVQVLCLLFAQFAPIQPPPSPPSLAPAPQSAAPLRSSDRSFEPAVRLGEPTPARAPATAFQLRDPAPATQFDDSERRVPINGNNLAPLRPASSVSLAPTAVAQPAAVSAPLLLSQVMTAPNERSLAGKPLSLSAALERVNGSASQLKTVKAYWLLSAAVADYHYALDEERFLASMTPPRPAHERASLRAAQAAAEARAKQAELAAVAAQQDLADAALLPPADALPLAKDAPFVGAYRTNFTAIFANRPVPAGLRRIDRTLPHYLTLMASRASSVAAADQSLDTMRRAYENGEVNLRDVLESFGHSRQQRREFLSTVRDYNLSIAEFALNSAGPGLSRETIVSMLIPATPRDKSVLVPRRDVQQASAQEPVTSASPTISGDVNSATFSPFRDVTPGRLVPVEPVELQPVPLQP
jgi:hypothetical protein